MEEIPVNRDLIAPEIMFKIPLDATAEELQPVPGTTLDEIDWQVAKEYRDSHQMLKGSNKEGVDLLKEIGALAAWPHGNSSLLHKSAVLVFCKRPEKHFIGGKSVFIVDLVNNDDRLKRKTIYGPLSKQFLELVKMTMDELRDVESLAEDGRRRIEKEIPLKLVREMISNAICHRDYESRDSIRIRINEKLLEIYSPGKFPSNISPQSLLNGDQEASKPVNPLVAEYLQHLLVFEDAGNGFRVARDYRSRKGEEAIRVIVDEGPGVNVRIMRQIKESLASGVLWNEYPAIAVETYGH